MKKNNQKKWKWNEVSKNICICLIPPAVVASIVTPIAIVYNNKPIIESGEVTLTFTGDTENFTIVSKYGEKPKLNKDFTFYVIPNVDYLTLESATIGSEQLNISNGNEVLIPADLMNSKNVTVEITLGLPKVKLTVDSAEGVTIGDAPIILGTELRIPVTCAPGVSITEIILYKDGKYFASSNVKGDAIGLMPNDDGSSCIFITGNYVTTYNISICIVTEDFFGPVEPITGESKTIHINSTSLGEEASALQFTFDISSDVIVEEETVPTFKFTNKLKDPLNGVFFFTKQADLTPIEWSIQDFTIAGGKEISFQPTIDWDEVTSMDQTYVPHFYAKQTLTGITYDNDPDSRSLKTTLVNTNPYTIYTFTTTLTKSLFEDEVYKTTRNNFNSFRVSTKTIGYDLNTGTPVVSTDYCPFTIIRKSDNLANWTMGYFNDILSADESYELYSSDEPQTISIDFVLNETIGENKIVINNPTFELKTGCNEDYSSTILTLISEAGAPEELWDAGFAGYYDDFSFADAFVSKDGDWTPEFTFKLDYELGEDKKYNFKFIDLNDVSEVKKSTTVEVEIKSNETLFSVKPNLNGFTLDEGKLYIGLEVEENVTHATINIAAAEAEKIKLASGFPTMDIDSSKTEVTIENIYYDEEDYEKSIFGYFVLKNTNNEVVASSDNIELWGDSKEYPDDITLNDIDWSKINPNETLDLHFVETQKKHATLTVQNNASDWIEIDEEYSEPQEIIEWDWFSTWVGYNTKDQSSVGKNIRVTLTVQGETNPILDKNVTLKNSVDYEYSFSVYFDWKKIPDNSTVVLIIDKAE